MEKNNNDGLSLWHLAFGLMLGVLVCLLMVGCKTKQKVVTEYVYVTDTVTTYHTDTINKVTYQVRIDTMRLKETHTITVNDVGDTIREVHFYHDSEKVIVVDSTDRYRATVDSLRAALTTEKNKYKEVTKTKHIVRWWEWLVILGIVGLLVYGAKLLKS